MTTPTQAQIEAVRKMADEGPMACLCDGDSNICTCATIIQLCNTAAARVGISDEERKMLDEASVRVTRRDAAQVGEPREPPFELQYSAKGIVRERNATIERCAQVADMQARSSNWQVADAAEAIAAAIRKLKDEP